MSTVKEGGGQPWDLGFVNGIQVLKVLKATGTNNHVQVDLVAPVEHLFSAVTDSLFANDTVGWSLGAESVTVDLTSSLTTDQLNQIEQGCNDFIRRGAAVEWKLFSKNELNNKDNAELALMRGGPKGAALELEELRMVRIEGLDLNPCGGTHLKTLSEINLLKVNVHWIILENASKEKPF
eukprot:gene25216-31647_t